jgi:hypothetical protein
MRDKLAERLLAKVMNWTPEDVGRERPILQAMASYKYDEYHQFSPGMRFVESFALWLEQYRTPEEKQLAYDFVKSRLIFISSSEMNHLVSMAYHDCVRPLLLRQVASEQRLNEYHVGKVAETTAFKIRQRQCLFLGLSDGARTDVFRRRNSPEISHEQVLQNYEISSIRAGKLLDELKKDLERLRGNPPSVEDVTFRTIVLLDDFSASGRSYLLDPKSDGDFTGKIAGFHRNVTQGDAKPLADLPRTQVIVLLYCGTERAREHLESHLQRLWRPLGVCYRIMIVHKLPNATSLTRGQNSALDRLLDSYYDPEIEDEHTRKGGGDVKYGFASCGLPVVLAHNTPNNSLYLLWAEGQKLRGLFPRVSRHRKLL